MSLERALSKLGAATRSEARALIGEGRVAIDGRVVTDPGHAVQPERQAVHLDGRSVQRSARIVVMLHKPKGVVTTLRDPEGRRTVYDLIKDVPARVLAVGRLDWATSGLLLFTNDSRLAAWLTDPANMVRRVYLVTVRGSLTPESAARLAQGVVVGGELLSAQARVRKRSGRETHLEVSLTEGKNREIRRLFSALGHEVTELRRVAFGGITLGRLPSGAWRLVSPRELEGTTSQGLIGAGRAGSRKERTSGNGAPRNQ